MTAPNVIVASAHHEPSPSHIPHSSTTALPSQSPAQSAMFPSQSHAPSAIPEPPQTPQSSKTNVEPHCVSQPEGPASKHPQPTSSEPSPPQTPQSSATRSPLHVPAQSNSHGRETQSPAVKAKAEALSSDTIK